MSERDWTTLIAVADLAPRLGDPGWVVVDTRFDLTDVGAGRADYLAGHVPGALYAHLDLDLSGAPLTDHGRHPLPGAEALVATFSRLGVGPGVQVVAYDRAEGATAARLWWLLRYMGHEAVAVLDGGFRAWTEAGLPVDGGAVHREPRGFRGEPRSEWLVTVESVPGAVRLIDARDPKRYRGEHEPIDPVAGHVPGAANHCFMRNVDEAGRFLAPEVLARQLAESFGAAAPEETVHYCGSGVTACHNLLAMAHAGMAPGRLYAGSWSEWCADPSRPVATGEDA